MAINEKNMRFKCTRTEDGKTIPVLCKYVLKVCRALSPSFGKGTVGNYWVAENQASLSELIKQAQDRGISLQAPAAAAPQPTAYPQQAPPQKTETPAPAGIVE